jgi:hypothetical protein
VASQPDDDRSGGGSCRDGAVGCGRVLLLLAGAFGAAGWLGVGLPSAAALMTGPG